MASGSAWRHVAAPVVVVAGALAYASAVGGDFVFDDRLFLVDNAKLDRPGDVVEFFRHGVWAFSNLTDSDSALYRPLFLVTLAVSRALSGDAPLGYHLVSLALHLVNSLLVLRLVTRLFREASWLPAFAGALLFAVHPVHVEAVAWISAVVHLLATTFLLGSFLLYLEHQESRATPALIGALVLFGLALLTQESAVTFPAVLAEHEAARHGDDSVRAAAYENLGVIVGKRGDGQRSETCYNLALAYRAVGDDASANYFASLALRLKAPAGHRRTVP